MEKELLKQLLYHAFNYSAIIVVFCVLISSCANNYIGHKNPASCRNALMVFSTSKNIKPFSDVLVRNVVIGVPNPQANYIKLRLNSRFDLFVREGMFYEYIDYKEQCFYETPLLRSFIPKYDVKTEYLVMQTFSKEKTPSTYQNEEILKTRAMESEIQLFLLSDSNYLWDNRNNVPISHVQLRLRKVIDSSIGSGRVYEDLYVPGFDERLITHVVGTVN